jgi:hypothetical protein
MGGVNAGEKIASAGRREKSNTAASTKAPDIGAFVLFNVEG